MKCLALSCSVLAFSACVVSPRGFARPEVPEVQIVTESEIQAYGLSVVEHRLEFGGKQDGTKLLIDFLSEAKARGASYVSDIRVHLVSRHEGQIFDCWSALVPKSTVHTTIQTRTVPSSPKPRWVMKPVSRMETRMVNECQMVTHPVTRTETVYESQYDSFSKSTRSVPRTRTRMENESRSECTARPKTEIVTRYENQLEMEYMPPRLESIPVHHIRWELAETEPFCEPMAEPSSGDRPSWIAGKLHAPASKPRPEDNAKPAAAR